VAAHAKRAARFGAAITEALMTAEGSKTSGLVAGLAYRPTNGEAMRELTEAVVVEKRGLEVENRKHGKREITLLSNEAWAVVCQELAADLPWKMRRVNLLVTGIDLPACIGHALTIGEVRIWVHGETRPCQLMEDQRAGLLDALKPDGRGGVHGQVISGGTIRVGDVVTLDPSGEANQQPPEEPVV